MEKEFVQYTPEFRKMVVSLLEDGAIQSISEARKKFNIGGSMTIHKWIKNMGKQNILPKLKLRKLKDEVEYLKDTDPELFNTIKILLDE